MEKKQNRPAWMEDELVRDIPREKLDILCRMFDEANREKQNNGRNLSQKEMLMRFMPLLRQVKAANLSFSPAELQAAVAAIKKHSSQEELDEIDRILKNQGRN